MANPMRGLAQRITEYFTTQSNAMVHTLRTVGGVWSRRLRSMLSEPTKDWGRADYTWWAKAYRCRVRGLELAGLFIKPLVGKIAAWALGMGVGWQAGNDAAQTALEEWWQGHQADVLRAYRGSLKLGDAFVVVNSDLTLTIVTPDAVDPIVAAGDYSKVIGWRITQVLTHPEWTAQRMTVIDEYYSDRRIQRKTAPGMATIETTYPNLLGRAPVVHIANALDESDSFGHPEAEALVELLLRYNTVLEAAIDGNERQGRPTPVLSFETVADLEKFWQTYGVRETQTLPDGTTETVTTLGVDLTQILTVSGAEFQYASPGSFTQDTERLLGLLFYLILEHTELPEFVFGNAIASSQASAETQMPIFERFIDGRRKEAAGWLTELAEIVLGYLALVQPAVSRKTPSLQWRKLSQDGALTLQAVSWAYSEGLLDERTALLLAPVEVANIDEVLALAKQEREERLQNDLFLAVDNPSTNDNSGVNNDGIA